jgi:signal transduction histidine kinase
MRKWFALEVLAILLFSLLAGFTLSRFDAFERFYDFSRGHEQFDLDEIALALPFLVFGVCVSLFVKLRRIMALEREAREALAKLEEANAAAEEAHRAKDVFLANSAHELRTPLNGVLGMLALLGESSLDREQREYLDLAACSSRQLSILLSDLLELARTDGTGDNPETSFDPDALLAQITAAFGALAKEKGLSFTVAGDGLPKAFLSGNLPAIRQIVFNLTGNALKFTTSGRVDVRAWFEASRDGSGSLFVTITDTGPGISAIRAAALTGDSGSGGAAGEDIGRGSGLGFGIVHRLVERIHAKVGVETREGTGTRITLSAPVSRLEQ